MHVCMRACAHDRHTVQGKQRGGGRKSTEEDSGAQAEGLQLFLRPDSVPAAH